MIYTKTGDNGTTSLVGGERVSKSSLRLEAYGTADELNSFVGWLRAEQLPDGVDAILARVQNKLFNLGGYLATDPAAGRVYPSCCLEVEEVTFLEHEIDKIQAELPPLHAFVLPGGSELISRCHICRTVCRRLERNMVALFAELPPCGLSESMVAQNAICLQYVNRLSDFLFILSRKCAKINENELFLWEK